jgi:hypothetical protein
MKRWCIEYDAKGEVTDIFPNVQSFLGEPQTSPIDLYKDSFYCDAIDELGAFAKFKEAWKKKEQRDASMHIL